ncbi:class 2 aldolase adducin domain containing protein [Grosmannia clavigera kw1407]|uniref:Class 2 aldolase adducin domain containing protein n=1 Tax=Grosmannia clavigera (strain kw1407 / UAMH 11150) TaxID=655863 RepID=F0XE66_GROCL|nr:class 2 aldolase adducin domain containing protein [Grosmannia clavigera kw1407]EFX04632.1 class 2 aldolase adducin domain containing protein [Grosmannia clavigera kw1407]
MTDTMTETALTLPAHNVLNTAPEGGKAKRIHTIPFPATPEEHRRWQLEQMAGAFRIFDRLGFADGASGHISLRDPVEPDTFWINPYAEHFGCLRVSDMVRVDGEGRRVGGAKNKVVNTAGFIIHSAIHAARPDIHAACHVHSPFGRAWSTFGRPLDMLNQDSCMFYDDLSVYAGFGGVVYAAEEGVRLAAALGPRNRSLILQNHGLLTCGGTVAEAAAFFIAMERACQAQLLVEAAVAPGTAGQAVSGLSKTLIGEAECRYTKDGTGTPEAMYMQFVPEYQRIFKETGGDYLE